MLPFLLWDSKFRLRLALGYHLILLRGSAWLHGVDKNSAEWLKKRQDEQAAIINRDDDDPIKDEARAFVKAMRVKSGKSFLWLSNPTTIFNLLITCIVLRPVELIMHTFFRQQREQDWKRESSTPLVDMANLQVSPAAIAMHSYGLMMATGNISDAATLTFLDMSA